MDDRISAISNSASGSAYLDISDVTTGSDLNTVEFEQSSLALDRALSQALTPPGGANPVEQERKVIIGGGKVGLEKAEMLADFDPEALRQASSQSDKEMDAIVERVKIMYTDFANWQVSWSMANSLQRDLSHLLKGQ